MDRLTESEEKEVKMLCVRAWQEFFNGNKTLTVSLDNIRLLMRAGARRIMYGRANKKWRVEVELKQHVFVHEDSRHFFVAENKRRSIFPLGPHLS